MYNCEYVQSLDSSITTIILPRWTCNDKDYTLFDFSKFRFIESIRIGDDSFSSVQTFKIDGLNRLKKLTIGINSFTKFKCTLLHYNYSSSFDKGDKMKSFHILNCESLESIEIGKHSFSDFGEFELKNLNSLQSITIGSEYRESNFSNNFCTCSFVLRGMEQFSI